VSTEGLQQRIPQRLGEILASCLRDPAPGSFRDFEKTLLGRLRSRGCLLIQLFLQARPSRRDLTPWTQARGSRVAGAAAERAPKTSCGAVPDRRAFHLPRRGGSPGVHPLVVALGLTLLLQLGLGF
jgi:hypothetical protein